MYSKKFSSPIRVESSLSTYSADSLISDLQQIQKDENDTLEEKEIIKKEICECEGILKRYDERRNQLKEKLKNLERRSHDFAKRRSDLIAKFEESSKSTNSLRRANKSQFEKSDFEVNTNSLNDPPTHLTTKSTFSNQNKNSLLDTKKTSKLENGTESQMEERNPLKRSYDRLSENGEVAEKKESKPSINKLSSDQIIWFSPRHTTADAVSNTLAINTSSMHSVRDDFKNITDTDLGREEMIKSLNTAQENQVNLISTRKYTKPIYKMNKLTITECSQYSNRSICFLKAIEQFIYVSCKDGTVKRYNIENPNECVAYLGHSDAAITILTDFGRNLIFTGSKNGIFRCFKMDTGYLMGSKSLFSQIQTIAQGWDRIVVALSNGNIIQLEFRMDQLSETNEKFKLKERILAITLLQNKRILVLLVNCRTMIVDATNGQTIKNLNTDLTYFPAFIEMDTFFCFTASSCNSMPLDNKKSSIIVYDQMMNWQVILRKQEKGVITAMQHHMKKLYVAILFRGFTRIHCYSVPHLTMIWIAYLNRERVFGLTIYGQYIITGSEASEITCFTPDEDGPYLCRNNKCNCAMPFARKADLETHQSRYFQ